MTADQILGDFNPHPVSQDYFLNGAVSAFQPKQGYRAGMDAVFLASAVRPKPGEHVLEAGMGVGVPSLCLAHRMPKISITGIEQSQFYSQLAQKNIMENNCNGRVQVICTDFHVAIRGGGVLAGQLEGFDHAFANPPFYDEDRGSQSSLDLRRAARNMPAKDLLYWVKALAALVRPGGTVTLIHRPEHLHSLLTACGRTLGNVQIAPLYPRVGASASRIIFQATKGSGAPLKLWQGLVLHSEDNQYTAGADRILRHADAFPW